MQPGPDLIHLKNLGPTTVQWLREIGIASRADLDRVGAVEAWRPLKISRPQKVTLNGLYALAGALLDVQWNDLPADLKAALRTEAGAD